MGRPRQVLGWAALALAAAASGAALLALAGRFDTRLDLLTHVTPLYVVGAVLAGAAGFAGGPAIRRAVLSLAAVALLACAWLIAPEFLRSAGPVAPPTAKDQIKVIQFNASRNNRRLDRIAGWLAEQNPDIAVIEEATPALRDRIIARTGWHVAGAATTVMIFSHQPYLTMRRPRRPATSKLVWVNATYAGASGPFEVVATHFTWPTEPIQAGQSLAMRQVTAALPRDRMILAGDFNSTPWSYARRADDAAFGLIRRDRALASWPAEDVDRRGLVAPFPFLPIDHVYAGAGWATVSVTRGPRLGSDHYPIIVTLAPVAR